MYGLPETNLDVLNPDIRKRLEDISQDFYGTSILATSASSLRSRTPYKPGGNMTGEFKRALRALSKIWL